MAPMVYRTGKAEMVGEELKDHLFVLFPSLHSTSFHQGVFASTALQGAHVSTSAPHAAGGTTPPFTTWLRPASAIRRRYSGIQGRVTSLAYTDARPTAGELIWELQRSLRKCGYEVHP